ncbi:MAG: methylmalonyl-CoA mutase [Candidatus Marinimicrobia bacterium]|nr:methylmalonyl-CoA mutase [Candidatus Neomarinimicrobiota bacterium]|tara:strand:- start:8932 stop:10590 length:1659 start_codon:yes stop_codon:yes gene_type:complete
MTSNGQKDKDSFARLKKAWEKEASTMTEPFRDENGDDRFLYYPNDPTDDFVEKIGFPGQYPYTRGIHADMYRGKLWTMRQFSGFGTPEETNQRYHFLMKEGQMGLSVAYDMPTLMGYDADHPFSEGEVGRCGVSVSSLKDMTTLFDGIDLGEVSVSQTINGPSIILLAFYIAVAEKQGVSLKNLRGTLQNDILKEFIAQKEWIFPPREHMRIVTDIIEFCTEEMPKFNTVSVSGYHIREAGSTAAQELAFTLLDGFCYVEHALERGIDIDKFAPRLSFFFNSHLNFLEEIAKFRAARRIWAKHMKERFGAKDPRSWKLRFHTQTAGCSLTAQQPENNIARTAFQALAGVLGGTQSLHTNSMDETLALPSQKAAEIALRTQQLIAYETGVTDVVDPLGGSWYIESLTDDLENEAEAYFEKVEKMGGVIPALEKGFFQREIARASFEFEKDVNSKDRIVVGVNEYTKEDEEIEIPILEIGLKAEKNQVKALEELRLNRDSGTVEKSLKDVENASRDDRNLVPPIVTAAKAGATMGEIVDAMKAVFGEWQETPVL